MIILQGQSGIGKTTVLKRLGDKLGVFFSQIDCLNHLTGISGINSLFEEIKQKIYQGNIIKSYLLEINNFNYYSQIIYANIQNKSERDLQDLKFMQQF